MTEFLLVIAPIVYVVIGGAVFTLRPTSYPDRWDKEAWPAFITFGWPIWILCVAILRLFRRKSPPRFPAPCDVRAGVMTGDDVGTLAMPSADRVIGFGEVAPHVHPNPKPATFCRVCGERIK